MNFIDKAFDNKLHGDDFLQAMNDIYSETEVREILDKYPTFVKNVILIIDYDSELQMGGLDEVTALEQGLFSGVDFIATLHAASPEEAVGRPQVQALQARGALHVLVWLKGRAEPGQVREVRFL